MPLTAQDIVQQACYVAKVPSMQAIAGKYLNMALSELCTAYELDVARKTFSFTFNSGAGQNSGPYTLPTDWLHANRDNVFYTILGVKYVMIPESLAEFNAQVQQPGLNAYPEYYAVDNSPISTGSAPLMYVWPPAGGSYPVTAVYYSQMPDIAAPETSAVIPWFPQQLYLLRRVTGEMMLLANDDRAPAFLGGATMQGGSTFLGAAALLDRYLKMKDDTQVTKTVTLDRRTFNSTNWAKLPNTKTIGWMVTLLLLLAGSMLAHDSRAARSEERVYAAVETGAQGLGEPHQSKMETGQLWVSAQS